MLELNMNGKRLSDNDITVLINKDSVQNITEVRFFTDGGEVILDDVTSTMDIQINILCDESANLIADDTKKSTMDKLKHLLRRAYQIVDDFT